jgi:superfamily II DNA or RNA helicase
MTTLAPEIGALVEVRARQWVVADVEADQLPVDVLELERDPQHLVTLRAVDDDAEPDETLRVVWEIEPFARTIERGGLPVPDSLDEPARFDCFLDAVRWGASTNADIRRYMAPFRSGIEIDAYQLDPLVRALKMPRVALLIADDVGLGKTIEAGLVIQELLLRFRARRVLIVVPADLQVQWHDEMRDKFGLEFRIVDSALVKKLRRERGVHANPWTHFPRLITSIDYLKREGPRRRFRETLPAPGEPLYPRRYDLLIVDEAHNVAPSGRKNYATDSFRTETVRELVPHFEHRLFLTATPHNGFDESFTALLELLDDQRFSRLVDPEPTVLRQVMVRRLKTELAEAESRHFAKRTLVPIEVDYPGDEKAAHQLLDRYAEVRRAAAGTDSTGVFAVEFVLKLLKKRLFSSPRAFARTLAQHRRTLAAKERAANEATVRAQLTRFEDETYETEDDYQEAEDAAQITAASTDVQVTEDAANLLDELERWAESASGRPDAKAECLLELIGQTCRPDGDWNDERLIVFTEYRDTQNALFELLAARGLTTDGRTEMLHGGLDTDTRTKIKEAFQAHPSESPVRILLATDAASEGINLQNHCSRLLHYEIPWNPNRLEQRNGRIDRHGQTADEVLIHHFVPAGFDADLDHSKAPGDLAGDLEFLARAVVKVERMRNMLGNVGPVIATQVTEAMLGKRREIDTNEAEKAGAAIARRFAFERHLREELAELERSYEETRAALHLGAENIRGAVELALELAHQPPLSPVGDDTYRLPQFSGAWARCLEGLEKPHTHQIRPITFDPAVARGRDDVVLCHLGHRLVQMSLRLLRAEIWREPGEHGLRRVTARGVTAKTVDGSDLDHPVGIVHARLVITGADGHRLHEELVSAGVAVEGTRTRQLGVAEVEALLVTASGGGVEGELERAVLDLHRERESVLTTAYTARARDRTESLQRTLERQRDQEIEKISAVLEELRRQIIGRLEQPDDPQQSLWESEERQQLEADRASLEQRAQQIPADILAEVAALTRRYESPSWHVFPAGVEWLVPEEWDGK